jgi:catechol 2,3-dioxygenase-like lactoylglutathione lyase family enzyme
MQVCNAPADVKCWPMESKVTYATPMVHVKDIETSIAFYEQLGFKLIDSDDGKPLGWARIHCEGGAMMFLRAEHPIDASAQAVIFVMYTPDLVAFRERMISLGHTVSEIKRPGYMPSGEVYMKDPDGFIVEVIHWSDVEQSKWEKHLAARNSNR